MEQHVRHATQDPTTFEAEVSLLYKCTLGTAAHPGKNNCAHFGIRDDDTTQIDGEAWTQTMLTMYADGNQQVIRESYHAMPNLMGGGESRR